MSVVATLPMSEESVAPVARRRSTGLDVARVLASLAIIWIHVPRSPLLMPSTIVARFAVPFFACAAVFFVVRKAMAAELGDWGNYALGRVRRIYLPFLGWCAIYLLFKAAKRVVAPEQDNDFAGIEMLWKGTAFHLWFLPFILAVSVVAYPLGVIAGPGLQARRLVAMTALVAGVVIAWVPWTMLPTADDSLIFMWVALPSAFWGATLALSARFDGGPQRNVLLIALAVFAALEATLVGIGRSALVENLAGVAFLIVAFQWSPDRQFERLAPLGAIAFGIYCSHLLFVKTAESVMTKLHVPISPVADLAVMLIATAGSVLAAWTLSRRRATRWLVV